MLQINPDTTFKSVGSAQTNRTRDWRPNYTHPYIHTATHAHSDTDNHTQAMTAADSITERYAAVMNSLIADCTHLEDRVAELENQLRATALERDDAVAAQQSAQRERDQAL